MRVAIMLPNWVGDLAMATPALRGLRRRFGPQAEIVGLVRPQLAPVLAGAPWLNRLIGFDNGSDNSQYRAIRVASRLRELRPDVFLHLTNSFKGALLGWLSGAPIRIGYRRRFRSWLLTHRLKPPRDPLSYVDYCLAVAELAGAKVDCRKLQLFVTEQELEQAERVWRALGFAAETRVAVLNTGGAYGGAKHWPAQHFAELARRVAEQADTQVLFLCGPAERQAVSEMVQAANHAGVHSLAEQPLSLGLSKACVSRSSVVVSTDSGPRHFAAAFDVPAVALFGPTDPRWADNYHSAEIHLREPLLCSPCAKRECPLVHHRCMRELSVERVFQAVAKQLRRDPARRVA